MSTPLGRMARRVGEAHRCTATNRMGERCGLAAIPFTNVCGYHGGRAPQVQRAAKERMLASSDLAVERLVEVLGAGDRCEVCGRSDDMNVIVKAAQIVLDRTGMHPTLAVQPATDVDDSDGWIHYATDEQLQQMQTWIEQARDRMLGRAPALEPAPLLLEGVVELVPPVDD